MKDNKETIFVSSGDEQNKDLIYIPSENKIYFALMTESYVKNPKCIVEALYASKLGLELYGSIRERRIYTRIISCT